MSELQNRLKLLQPYLVQLRFPEGAPVVDMVFKKGWHVPKSEVIQSTKGDSEEMNYHMFYCTKEGLGLDQILDYIQKVIGLNIEREKKHALLKVKVKELQELFRANPLSKLQNMTYQLGGKQPMVVEMVEDPEDVVDFDIEAPIVTMPQPQPVAQPQPQPVAQPQPEAQPEAQPVSNDPNVRYAPNGEVIPPLAPEDRGEIEDDFQKFDLTAKESSVTKKVNGRAIDLPPKNTVKKPAIQLDEIEGPQNVVCKCGPEDVCPACEEQKIGTY